MTIGLILMGLALTSIIWLVIVSNKKIESISKNGYGSARKNLKGDSK